MNHIKRHVLILISCTIFLLLLAGCSGPSSSAQSQKNAVLTAIKPVFLMASALLLKMSKLILLHLVWPIAALITHAATSQKISSKLNITMLLLPQSVATIALPFIQVLTFQQELLIFMERKLHIKTAVLSA